MCPSSPQLKQYQGFVFWPSNCAELEEITAGSEVSICLPLFRFLFLWLSSDKQLISEFPLTSDQQPDHKVQPLVFAAQLWLLSVCNNLADLFSHWYALQQWKVTLCLDTPKCIFILVFFAACRSSFPFIAKEDQKKWVGFSSSAQAAAQTSTCYPNTHNRTASIKVGRL